ncbi:hypothetical protein [Comamonas terrae]|uniref:Uncharacterized protein n=1 Tax=Comamonas terrae TaxID=673548 RepID=A0ABW5UL38_9BURK|nr:hypothetical protein [Comamonas terrae]
MDVSLTYEDELDAARDAIRHLGGPKRVGEMLYPDKSPEAAARYLLDALNPARDTRLSPGQLLLLMRKCREAGFDGLTAYILNAAGYAPPVPLDPTTEAMKLTRELDRTMDRAEALVSHLQRLRAAGVGAG